MAKLTKTYIDKIEPPECGYDLHWDTETRGFDLRATNHGKRTYIVQGRVNGKEARITIGAHGVFTVDHARDDAKEHLRNMKKGIDPRDVAKEWQSRRYRCATWPIRICAPPAKGQQQGRDRTPCDHNL